MGRSRWPVRSQRSADRAAPFQVCLGIYGTGIVNTGMAIYPWLFIFSVRNVVAAMQDARRSDDQFKSEVEKGAKR